MILTKRLYRLDEVRSAFLYSLKKRRFMEGIFWLHELEDSCYGGEARRLLLLGWMMFVGLRQMSWLFAWANTSITQEGRLRLCWQLMRCSESDSSIWWLLCSGVVGCENGYSRVVDTWNEQCHLDDNEFWSLVGLHKNIDARLQVCIQALQKDMNNYKIFAKAIGHCCCNNSNKSSWSELSTSEPIDLHTWLQEWNSQSLRNARIFEIPYNCLFGMTERSCSNVTSIDELNDILPALKSSPYWKRILQQSYTTIEGEWISDELKENFYDTYFGIIDDIPDEWSIKEKKKSHGMGVDCSQGAPFIRWWNNWISKEHMWIWGKDLSKILKWCKEQRADVYASIFDRISILYKERMPIQYISKVPQKKEFILMPLLE